MLPAERNDASHERERSATFHQVVHEHAPGLFRLACALVRNSTDAEDVLQETFLGAWERWGAFEGRSSVRTWLTQILLRRVARHRRYGRIRKLVSLDAGWNEGANWREAEAEADSPQRVQARLDVAAMLNALSPKLREVIVLRDLDGMTYDEIAEALSVPRGTVESRLYRARQTLKRQFPEYQQ